MKLQNGFTLIEVMITVVIIAILAAVALPNYNDYVTRGRIPDATSVLANRRVQAEQYFQDNRTYLNVGGFTNPACIVDNTGRFFDFSCSVQTAATFTTQAQGKGAMAGFNYTINEANLRTSPLSGAPTGWTPHSPDNCWVTNKGGTC